jgi:hypothetical protein
MFVGLFSSLGVAFLLEPGWLLPLTGGFLALALVSLWLGRRGRWGLRPFVLGLVATAVILVGKFALDSDVSTYAGTALLVIAAVWNLFSTTRRSTVSPRTGALIEVFSAGCVLCENAARNARTAFGDSCEVRVLSMGDPDVARRAKALGIRTFPAMLVDGRRVDP